MTLRLSLSKIASTMGERLSVIPKELISGKGTVLDFVTAISGHFVEAPDDFLPGVGGDRWIIEAIVTDKTANRKRKVNARLSSIHQEQEKITVSFTSVSKKGDEVVSHPVVMYPLERDHQIEWKYVEKQ